MPVPPAPDDVPSSALRRIFHSDETGWVSDADLIPAGVRRALWQRPLQLVEGEPTTGYTLAAYAADLSNLVVNTGRDGLQHINLEATMSLSRPPRGHAIGLLATHASEHDGISAGSAVLFDEDGPIGVSSASAISNPRAP